MTWQNTQLDKLPHDRQEVLISLEGIYYKATFYEQNRRFVISEESREVFAGESQIYWKALKNR